MEPFRLGELVLVPDEPHLLSPGGLAESVVASGYDALEGADGWQHFRPRSAWWRGVRRHARLRRRDLHVRGEHDGARTHVRFVGVLTASLERQLASLGAVHGPSQT